MLWCVRQRGPQGASIGLRTRPPEEQEGGGPVRLTDKLIATRTCPGGAKDKLIFDAQTKGLALRLTAAGGRSFILQYKLGRVRRRLPLGDWPGMTLAAARKAAERHRGAVADGRDPWAERKASQAAARVAVAEARRKKAEVAFTVEALLGQWLRAHATARRASTLRDVNSRIRHNLKPLLKLPAAGVTRADAVRAIDRIAGGETTARRTLAYARSIYSWAVMRGAAADNPFRGRPMPGREVERDRALTDEELGAVWKASDAIGQPYGPMVRFLMLTLARREEVAAMAWGEVAPDLSAWTQPGGRAKNRKPHVVHLSEPARAVLRALLPSQGAPPPDALVFAHIGGKKLTGFSNAKAALDEASGVAGWRLHDLRRSGVTTLARLGVAPHVADRLLNHVTDTIGGVAAIYQRHDFADERRRALDAWAAHVLRCAEGKDAGSNVVPLRSAV